MAEERLERRESTGRAIALTGVGVAVVVAAVLAGQLGTGSVARFAFVGIFVGGIVTALGIFDSLPLRMTSRVKTALSLILVGAVFLGGVVALTVMHVIVLHWAVPFAGLFIATVVIAIGADRLKHASGS